MNCPPAPRQFYSFLCGTNGTFGRNWDCIPNDFKFWVANWKTQKQRWYPYLLFRVKAVTMEKRGGIEKQMAAYVDGVFRSVLEYTLQSQDDGLLVRGDCIS